MGIAMELGCSRICSSIAPSSMIGACVASNRPQRVNLGRGCFKVRAAAEDVGTEEVGNEKLEAKVIPNPGPQQRKWTGYVEKDTAGQTNIYSVEPTVYVSESVFSTGESGGTSEGGAQNSAAIAFGLGLAAIASAASVLFTVGKNAPVPPTAAAVGYSGPPLSFYIAKFSPEGAAGEGAVAAVEGFSTIAPELVTLETPESANLGGSAGAGATEESA